MLYFYCGEIVFHSDDLIVGDVTYQSFGSVEYQRIETIEQFDSFSEDLKKILFTRIVKKNYPSASLSDCELILLALNPL